ncbi:MAG: T9SS type A sorting domain-containing protein, partial [Ginsengibacter sp.]
FTDIAFIAGSGNSSLAHNYQFTDDKVLSGSNYYRLKQIDLDGRFIYSSIIKLNYSKFAWAILGNPILKNSWVQVQIDKTSDVIIRVVSMNGNVIQTINKGKIATGTYSIPMNLGQVSSGIYMVQLILDGKTYSKEIFK